MIAWRLVVGGCLGVLLGIGACSSAESNPTTFGKTPNPQGGSGGASGSGAGATGGMFGSGGGLSTGGTGGQFVVEDACAGEAFTAASQDIDIYILLDQSSSMNELMPQSNEVIWSGVTRAITSFVQLPTSAGLRVGLQYFGILSSSQTCATPPCSSCNPADYATPAVPIAALPGNAQAIVSSIQQHAPSTFTPTVPAYEGVLGYAQTWAAQNPDRLTVVVLATDGFPTECSTDLNQVRTLAEQAANADPRVLTFAIGIGAQVNLNSVALAGGTGKAFLISGANVEQQFAQAMASISATPLACEYEMPKPPDGGVVAPNFVNVKFTPALGQGELLTHVVSVADCFKVTRGWYYDNETSPTRIFLCDSTCEGLGAGTLELIIGCRTFGGPT
jgi:hypothetical protein